MLCLLSSRFRRIEHQTRWICTALWPRSVALRIRSLPHDVLLAQFGIGDATETTASVHALLRDDPPRAVARRRRFRHRHPHAWGVEARQNGKLQAQTSMRTASNQARKHWRGFESGFNQVCTCQLGSVTRTSLVRPFFSCQFLILHATFGLSCFWNLSQLFSGCTSPNR